MRRALLATLPFVFVCSFAFAQPAASTKTGATPVVKVEGKLASTPAAAPAATQPVAPTAPPATAAEAVEQAKVGVAFIKARNWFGVSAVAIFVLMFILTLTPLFTAIGKRWSYILNGVLSLGAMLLAKFAGGVSWEAAWLVLTSGPAAGALSDLFKRGIMGWEPTTTVSPAAPPPAPTTPQ